MRRLLILLLLILGIGAIAPAAMAPARASPNSAIAHGMPGGCHDQGTAASHVCIGCAVAPEGGATIGHAAPPASAAYRTIAPARLVGRDFAFDPPPPRFPG